MTKEPALITRIRKMLDGLSGSEGALDKLSNADLDKAIAWAAQHDSSLLVDLDDEVEFRLDS